MISTTAAILYFVAVAVTAVSIVAAISALRATRRLEEQMLRWEEAGRATPHHLSRDGFSSTESRLSVPGMTSNEREENATRPGGCGR